jgi:dienelactone hydrolase
VRYAVVALALVVAGCGGAHSSLHVRVTPGDSVEDQPIRIRVDGLAPHEHVSLVLRSHDARGVVFSSHAVFAADGSGELDLLQAKPLRGSSYAGVWPMGLLTSMSAPKAPPFADYRWNDGAQKFQLTVTSKGRTLGATSFTRRWRRGAYTKLVETIAKNGFDGTFYSPVGARRQAAVLAFGGSEGGDNGTWEGERLAAHGIPTLFIGYFHAPGLPDRLVDIPLEYFRTALQWLEHRPEVDPARTSVFGISYGSEAALLLGVHFPHLVHGVAALVPSSVVTCGILGANRVVASSRNCLGSPWTLHGRPLPHTKLLNDPSPWDDPLAVIPVERIRSPVLLACAGNDQRWSSCAYSRAIVARRKAHGESTQLYSYPDAGHDVGSPDFVYEPGSLANDIFVPASERGREDLWPRLLTFLHAVA